MLRQYGESGWSIREDTYVKIAAGGIGVGFAAGDGVVIEGCREESHQRQPCAGGGGGRRSGGTGDDRQSDDPDGGTLTVRRSVPEMDFVIESGNRLWGCKIRCDRRKGRQ